MCSHPYKSRGCHCPLQPFLTISLSRLCSLRPPWQMPCSQQLAASLSLLPLFFSTAVLYFQSLADSFPKTPGVGGTYDTTYDRLPRPSTGQSFIRIIEGPLLTRRAGPLAACVLSSQADPSPFDGEKKGVHPRTIWLQLRSSGTALPVREIDRKAQNGQAR